MKKKNSYLLKTAIFIFVLVLLASGLYNYTIYRVNAYYSLPDGDIQNETVTVLGNSCFDDDKLLVYGTFRQNDDLMTEKMFFIKLYNLGTGDFIKSASAEIPQNYSLSDTAASSSAITFLFTDETANTSPAYYICFSEDGVIQSSGYVKYHDSSSGNAAKTYFVFYSGDELRFGILVDVNITVYNSGLKQISRLAVMPGSSVTDIVCLPDGSYAVTGTITSGYTYHAYYSRFSASGEEIYSRTMLSDYTSKGSEISYITSDTDGSFYILGYYFDSASFIANYYNNADTFSEEDIAKISDESIQRTEAGINVLIQEKYRTAPWCNIYIVKVESDGTVNTVLNTADSGSGTGTSSAKFISNSITKGETYRKTPLAIAVSATAKKSTSDEYQLRYYYVYADLSSGVTTDLSISSDIYVNIIGKSDDETGIYTTINGKNTYSLHTYTSAITEQNDLKINTICRLFVDYVNNSYSLLPMIILYGIIIITLGYKKAEFDEYCENS